MTPVDAAARQLWSVEAEAALLGGMVHYPSAAPDIRLSLESEMFYRPAHRLIFGALDAMLRTGQSLHLSTLVEELKARGDLANVGGLDYMTGLDFDAPPLATLGGYADIVRDKHALRRLEQTGRDLVGKVRDIDGGTAPEIAEWLGLATSPVGGSTVGIRSLADVDESGGDEGVPTGIQGVDRRLGTRGAPKGQLNVVVAKEKAGKSTLLMAMALHAAREGRGVLYLSLADLNAKRVKRRLLRMMSGYSERWTADQAGALDDFLAAKTEIERDIALEIGDMRSLGTVDVDALVATVEGYRQKRARTTTPLDLVFVDYYQKLKAKGFSSSGRVAMLDHCSDALSAYAERSGVVVWMGSQLTDGDQRAGRELMTKGSRAPLEDCGVTLHLDRGEGESAVVAIYRSRFGGMGTKVPMRLNPLYVRFDEVNGG